MVFFISSLVFQDKLTSQMQFLGDDRAENTFSDPTMTQFIITTCITQSWKALWTGHQTHSPTVRIDKLKSTLPSVCLEMSCLYAA